MQVGSKAYEVAQEAMMMFGMSTSDRAVKTLVQAFLVSARIAKERSNNEPTLKVQAEVVYTKYITDSHQGM